MQELYVEAMDAIAEVRGGEEDIFSSFEFFFLCSASTSARQARKKKLNFFSLHSFTSSSSSSSFSSQQVNPWALLLVEGCGQLGNLAMNWGDGFATDPAALAAAEAAAAGQSWWPVGCRACAVCCRALRAPEPRPPWHYNPCKTIGAVILQIRVEGLGMDPQNAHSKWRW